MISNYISPLIGDVLLDDVTPRMMDKFYRELLTVKSVGSKYVKPRNEFVSPHIVREIHKLLRNAFNQAVKWELMTRNPVEHATLPKEEHTPRDIWTVEVLFKALDACEDDNLLLAMNLVFSCTLRMGELLGLTWDCVDIYQTSIDTGQAYIFVNKELQRVRHDARGGHEQKRSDSEVPDGHSRHEHAVGNEGAEDEDQCPEDLPAEERGGNARKAQAGTGRDQGAFWGGIYRLQLGLRFQQRQADGGFQHYVDVQ